MKWGNNHGLRGCLIKAKFSQLRLFRVVMKSISAQTIVTASRDNEKGAFIWRVDVVDMVIKIFKIKSTILGPNETGSSSVGGFSNFPVVFWLSSFRNKGGKEDKYQAILWLLPFPVVLSGAAAWGRGWPHLIYKAGQTLALSLLSTLSQTRGYITGLAINEITRKGAGRPWPGHCNSELYFSVRLCALFHYYMSLRNSLEVSKVFSLWEQKWRGNLLEEGPLYKGW